MIPTTFTLGGLKFNIQLVDDIDDTGLGRALNCLGDIKISKHFHGRDIPENSMERTFYHELTHAILDEIGFKSMSDNEQFVDTFSAMLYQFEQIKSFN
jgi:hypothetical protein